MRDGQASFTSRMVMLFRALAVREGIPIFKDTIAEHLLNEHGQRIGLGFFEVMTGNQITLYH